MRVLVRLLATVLLVQLVPNSNLKAQYEPADRDGFVLPDSVLLALDDPTSFEEARRQTLEIFVANGFFEAVIRRDSDSIVVDPGRRYLLDTDEFSLDVGDRLPFFSTDLLSADVANRLRAVEERGYPLASARVAALDIDSAGAMVRPRIVVDSGTRCLLTAVEFTGSERSADRFLRRTTGLEIGSIYSRIALVEGRERLLRTGLFLSVSEAELVLEDTTGVLARFVLVERPASSFDGLIGYAPARPDGSDGFFTGLVSLRLKNLFGSGEEIAGEWSKPDAQRSLLSIAWRQPWLFGSPVGIDLAIDQRSEDETPLTTAYVSSAAEVGGFLEEGPWEVSAGFRIAGQAPTLDTLLGACSERVLPSATTISGLFGLAYDRRDNPVNPAEGSSLAVEYVIASRARSSIGCELPPFEIGSFARNAVALDIATFRRLIGPLVGAVRVRGAAMFGESVDAGELYRFGGAGSVRGFREGARRVSAFSSISFEPRLLLGPDSHVAPFVDAGYFDRRDVLGFDETEDGILLGFGVAAQIETPAGLARVSVGLAEGESVENALLSVGFAGQF